jgi:hypothetical protein
MTLQKHFVRFIQALVLTFATGFLLHPAIERVPGLLHRAESFALLFGSVARIVWFSGE